jgi:hypothetical protein
MQGPRQRTSTYTVFGDDLPEMSEVAAIMLIKGVTARSPKRQR